MKAVPHKLPRLKVSQNCSAPFKVKDIFHFLNQWAPVSLAERWDHVGLQVGSLKNSVKGILVALDVTSEVLEEAKKNKCNLLITHHPLMFESLKKLQASSLQARLARKALRQKINILSFHTNLDSTPEGLNDLLASRLGIQSVRVLEKSLDSKYPKAGLGRIGKIKKTSFKNFLRHLSKSLSLENFRYVGNLSKPIQNVAVMTGSGGAYFLQAKKKGADVLVTGDVKYHGALDALAEGIALVDIGHFEGEIGMVALVAQKLRFWLQKASLKLPVHETKSAQDPFSFW